VTADLDTFCEHQLTRLREAGALTAFDAAPAEIRDALPRVVSASDFVREALSRSPELAKWLIDEVGAPLVDGQMVERLGRAVEGAEDLPAFMMALRRHREREMLRIAWRDLAGNAATPETLADTSAFADAAIQAALAFATTDLERSYG
jgi:glutamate-ammonia-ligase adenylyltransferase